MSYVDDWGVSIDDEALGGGSGSALSTVTPNPQVQNGSHDWGIADISQLASVAGQWGATIAGIVNNTPVQATPGGVTTGVRGVQGTGPMSGSTGILLVLVIGVVVVLLVMKK